MTMNELMNWCDKITKCPDHNICDLCMYNKGKEDAFSEIRDAMTFHRAGLSGYFTISLEEYNKIVGDNK